MSLVVANPDGEAPPLRTDWALDGAPAATVELGVSARPVRIHLLVPDVGRARGAVRVELDHRRGAIPTAGARSGSTWARSGCWPAAAGPRRSTGRHRAGPRGAAGRGVARGLVGRRAEPLPPPPHAPGDARARTRRRGAARPGMVRAGGVGEARRDALDGGRAEAYLGHDGRARRSASASTRASRGSVRWPGRLVVERLETDGPATRPGGTVHARARRLGASCPCRSRRRPGSCESRSTPSRCGSRAIACPARGQPRARPRGEADLAGLTAGRGQGLGGADGRGRGRAGGR